MTPSRLVAQAGCAVLVIGALSLAAREGAPDATAFIAVSGLAASPAFASLVDDDPPLIRDDPGSSLQASEPARSNPTPGSVARRTFTQGSFAAIETPYLRLTATAGPVESSPALFVILVRRAADGLGLFVARTGERGRIDSTIGPVETLETTFRALSEDNGGRACTGFATRPPARVQVDGWLCAPLGQMTDHRAIACALDELGLDKPSPNGPLASGSLAQAKARHGAACSPAPNPVSQTESIGGSHEPNKAKVRRNAQAKP